MTVGIEPTTLPVETGYSIQLSYVTIKYTGISFRIKQKKYFFDLQGKKVQHSRAMVNFFDALNRKKMNFDYSKTCARVLK